MRPPSRLLRRALGCTAIAIGLCPACAASSEGQALFGTNLGFGPDADRFGAHLERGVVDRASRTGHRWTFAVEMGLSKWTTSKDGRKSAWQMSAVPFVRLWRGRFYGEFGIGASVFSVRSVGTQELGSSFQFCDHLGAGYEWSGTQRLGIRLSHFSNARIASPNDGLDLIQIVYTRAL